MFKRLKKAFKQFSVDSTSLDRIRFKIIDANLTMTTILSTFATLLITVLLIASFFSDGVNQNKNVYVLGLVLSLTICVLSITVAPKHTRLVKILVYLSYSIYYMYGIIIGTITDYEGKTVTFMVLLVFLPTLFIEWPIRVFYITSIYVTIFIALCFQNKTGAVLSVDIIDSIVFSLLGLTSGYVVNNTKIRGFIIEQQLQEISRIDQLTQMRNRNAYELEHLSIIEICKQSLAVIYIDVNGLHEVNNEKGHDYGDRMLKCIASEVKKSFSDEYTYRIGGDEFIAFVPDKNDEEIETSLQNMIQRIEKENYYVAIGYEISKIKHLSVELLINKAEKKMLNNKRNFYKDIANRKIRNDINTDM